MKGEKPSYESPETIQTRQRALEDKLIGKTMPLMGDISCTSRSLDPQLCKMTLVTKAFEEFGPPDWIVESWLWQNLCFLLFSGRWVDGMSAERRLLIDW